jgi:hypothetical protein
MNLKLQGIGNEYGFFESELKTPGLFLKIVWSIRTNL